MRLFFPVAVSIASYGVVWGVLAGQAGLSPLEVVLMSGIVYAGSSQFVAITMWSPAGLPIASIVVATAIINLRMLLMTATLRPRFDGSRAGRRCSRCSSSATKCGR
jgi:predicted branched-subunit amino acid permease